MDLMRIGRFRLAGGQPPGRQTAHIRMGTSPSVANAEQPGYRPPSAARTATVPLARGDVGEWLKPAVC